MTTKNKAYDYSINDYKEYNIPNSPFGPVRVYLIDGLQDIYFNGMDIGRFLNYKDSIRLLNNLYLKTIERNYN